jgi:hypothetical protein
VTREHFGDPAKRALEVGSSPQHGAGAAPPSDHAAGGNAEGVTRRTNSSILAEGLANFFGECKAMGVEERVSLAAIHFKECQAVSYDAVARGLGRLRSVVLCGW